MHELSIAIALLDIVEEHAPPGSTVRRVDLRIGPLQAIEPDVLRLAWAAITRGTGRQGARLRMDLLPWRLHCTGCGRDFESRRVDEMCTCGSSAALAGGSDDLILTSLEVDDAVAAPAV